jgi:hypothetical protein
MKLPDDDECLAHLQLEEQSPTLSDKAFNALTCLSYKKTALGLPGGRKLGPAWSFVDRRNHPGGYDAMAWTHGPSRTLVVINRGMEGLGSVPDFKQAVRLTGGFSKGSQMDLAVGFLADCYAETFGRVDRVVATGHSMGAGLAEAQVALGPSLLASWGVALSAPITGLGFGSAGFAKGIRDMAVKTGLAISADVPGRMRHRLRTRDILDDPPIKLEHLGTITRPASIYQPVWLPKDGRNPTGAHAFKRHFDSLRNHDRYAYFAWGDVPATRHLFVRHSGIVEVRDGAVPIPYRPPPQAPHSEDL